MESTSSVFHACFLETLPIISVNIKISILKVNILLYFFQKIHANQYAGTFQTKWSHGAFGEYQITG